jgi:hypothetical protein
MTESTVVVIPTSQFAKLLSSHICYKGNPDLQKTVETLIQQNIQLQASLAKAKPTFTERLINQPITKEICMDLADTLKVGRSYENMDAIEAVERYLRRKGFGAINFDQILQSDLE